MDDLVNAARVDPHVLGKTVLSDAKGFNELVKKNLSRMGGRQLFGGHAHLLQAHVLMIIGDLEIIGVTINPAKVYPPLIVDSHAMLASASTP